MPAKVVHRLAEIIRFRLLMIAAGYEDGNDPDALRGDPMFKGVRPRKRFRAHSFPWSADSLKSRAASRLSSAAHRSGVRRTG
jgi:hypothetical protein